VTRNAKRVRRKVDTSLVCETLYCRGIAKVLDLPANVFLFFSNTHCLPGFHETRACSHVGHRIVLGSNSTKRAKIEVHLRPRARATLRCHSGHHSIFGFAPRGCSQSGCGCRPIMSVPAHRTISASCVCSIREGESKSTAHTVQDFLAKLRLVLPPSKIITARLPSHR
jgi:hypothetical protein